MNDCTYIILGASGDLAKRKLIPALYQLFVQKKLTKFLIVGAALEDISLDEIFNQAKHFIKNVDEELFEQLKSQAFYQKLDFLSLHDFVALEKTIAALEKKYQLSGNRL